MRLAEAQLGSSAAMPECLLGDAAAVSVREDDDRPVPRLRHQYLGERRRERGVTCPHAVSRAVRIAGRAAVANHHAHVKK